jgi:hypothetical protein
MSALPSKADMCGALSDVRFGPIADIQFARHDGVRFCPENPMRQETADTVKCRTESVGVTYAPPTKGSYKNL